MRGIERAFLDWLIVRCVIWEYGQFSYMGGDFTPNRQSKIVNKEKQRLEITGTVLTSISSVLKTGAL